MPFQPINLGTPNAQNGDPLRSGGDKINDNFTEVYSDISALSGVISGQTATLTGLQVQINTATSDITTLDSRVDGNDVSISTLQTQVASLLYVPMDITSLTNNVGTVEIGTTISSITFNWAVNKLPATLAFNQGIGPINSGLTTLTTGVNITSNTTYTLTANDGTSYPGNTDTASTTVSFQNRVYWGTSASTSLNSAGILGLANSAFATSRARSFTINGNAQYIYYAYPASFGDATFTVNGLVSTAWTKTVVSFTNASGNTSNYNVYRSNTIQNGDGIQISIS